MVRFAIPCRGWSYESDRILCSHPAVPVVYTLHAQVRENTENRQIEQETVEQFPMDQEKDYDSQKTHHYD